MSTISSSPVPSVGIQPAMLSQTDVDRAQAKPSAHYRVYFLAAIFILLTTGAGWGTWFLWQIAVAGKVTGVSLHQINAHGQTVLYGFLGLFIMGFAYQAFPRLWQRPLAWPALCRVAFVASVAGMAMLVLSELRAELPDAPALAIGGGIIHTIGVLLFCIQMLATFRRGPTPLNAVTATLLVATGFFLLHTPLNAIHTFNLVSTESKYEAIHLTSVYQPALRYLQLHGMVLLMVIGVSSRLLTSFYTILKPSERKLWTILIVITLSVLLEAGLFVAFRYTEIHWIAAFLLIPWLAILICSIALVVPWKLWHPLRDPMGRVDRSSKFVRASFAWLIVSLLMTIALPGWSRLVDTYFSHAWYGASRQAFTVGFATMMIIAFSSRIVPTLNGIYPNTLGRLAGPFGLINVGLALHVVFQISLDLHPAFAYGLPIAGVMQWIGIAWWAMHLIQCIWTGSRRTEPSPRQASGVQLRVLNKL